MPNDTTGNEPQGRPVEVPKKAGGSASQHPKGDCGADAEVPAADGNRGAVSESAGYLSAVEVYDHAPKQSAFGVGGVLRFAYADPPYFGLAAKFYGHLHAEAADYDKLETHAALIAKLCAEYDGWAMSLHTPTLRDILPLCPPDVRVMAWVKPFASFKPGVGVAYAWEPLIVRGGRRRTREQLTVRDWCSCNITLKRGFTGAKPEGVVEWLLEVLNVEPQDVFDDLFHGSGAVSCAVANYFARPKLALSTGVEEGCEFPGMRVELPKGESVASEGRKDNE